MSYILEALRKSDQLRRRGAAPTLLLGPTQEAAPKRTKPLAYGLLALLLLGAGIAIGWLRPWQTENVISVPADVVAKPVPPGQSAAPAIEPKLEPKVASKPEPGAEKQASAPALPAAPAPKPAAATAQAQAGASGKAEGAKEPQATLPAQESAPAVVAAPAVVNMAELPVSIQQQLPALSISVHAYSGKPAERLVGINNRLLHEGEEVAPGLKLEQITPDGMIFAYRGYRFHRGVH